MVVATCGLVTFTIAGLVVNTRAEVKADQPVEEPSFTQLESPLSSAPQSQVALAAPVVKRPFYQDTRYLLLIADGLIISALILTLVVRLITKLFSQSTLKPSATGRPAGAPVTVDQLDVDIPV